MQADAALSKMPPDVSTYFFRISSNLASSIFTSDKAEAPYSFWKYQCPVNNTEHPFAGRFQVSSFTSLVLEDSELQLSCF